MGAPRYIGGHPIATAHQSGTMLRTVRQPELVEVGNGGSVRNEKEDPAVHAPEGTHAESARHGVSAELNTISVGSRALRSLKRLRARLKAARDLDEAMILTGSTGPDIGAALDYSREIVQRIRVGEAPFEVAHLRLLPMAMMAIILARLVARLDVAGRALFDDEERRVRGMVMK